jgi:hypothetical protein
MMLGAIAGFGAGLMTAGVLLESDPVKRLARTARQTAQKAVSAARKAAAAGFEELRRKPGTDGGDDPVRREILFRKFN